MPTDARTAPHGSTALAALRALVGCAAPLVLVRSAALRALVGSDAPLALVRSAALLALVGCATPTAERAPAQFPDDWVGRWSGALEMHGSRPSAGEVRMELDIAPTDDPDRFRWLIAYDGPEGRQERDYVLVVRNRAEGRHAIDERNGIVLETRELGGAIYSWFSIAGVNIVVREQLVRGTDGDHIAVEMTTAADRDAIATGPAGEVRSIPPVSVQRARLKRLEQRVP